MKSDSRGADCLATDRLERARLAQWLLRSPDNVRRLVKSHGNRLDLEFGTLDRGKQIDLPAVIARASAELAMGHEPSPRSELLWDWSGYPRLARDKWGEHPHAEVIPFRQRSR